MRKILYYVLLGIGAVIILFLLIGMVWPTVVYTSVVEIDAPVEKTWAVFMDEKKANDWMDGFQSIELLEGEPNHVGSKYRLHLNQNGQDFAIDETITIFDPPNRYSFDTENEVLRGHIDITLEPVSEKTMFKASSKVKGKNILMRSLFNLMKSGFASEDNKIYYKLKNAVETAEWPPAKIETDTVTQTVNQTI